jgi:hypothetical protein
MRRRLAATGDEFTETLKSKFTEFIDEVKNEAANAKDRVNQFVESGVPKLRN